MFITEGLAEIKTIGKRITSKRAAKANYLLRPATMIDPLSGQGGSIQFLEREEQAIRDLETRIIQIRGRIQETNLRTMLTIDGVENAVTDWLTWRKEIAQPRLTDLQLMATVINRARSEASRKGGTAAAVGTVEQKSENFAVNVNEVELHKEIEGIQATLSTLDGKLSLLNATTQIAGL
jgi:hypothetical protein